MHEVVKDSIDEVGVHEGDNNPLMIAFTTAKLPAIELEMAKSPLQRFVAEKCLELT